MLQTWQGQKRVYLWRFKNAVGGPIYAASGHGDAVVQSLRFRQLGCSIGIVVQVRTEDHSSAQARSELIITVRWQNMCESSLSPATALRPSDSESEFAPGFSLACMLQTLSETGLHNHLREALRHAFADTP